MDFFFARKNLFCQKHSSCVTIGKNKFYQIRALYGNNQTDSNGPAGI
jgi:hypothetical protein